MSHVGVDYKSVIATSHVGVDYKSVIAMSHVGVDYKSVIAMSHVGVEHMSVIAMSHVGVDYKSVIAMSHVDVEVKSVNATSHAGVDYKSVIAMSHVGVEHKSVTDTSHVGVDYKSVTAMSHVGVDYKSVIAMSHVGVESDIAMSKVGFDYKSVIAMSHVGVEVNSVIDMSNVGVEAYISTYNDVARFYEHVAIITFIDRRASNKQANGRKSTLKDDESHLTTADAVSLFKSSLNKALQRQKSEILSEFKKTQVSSVNAKTRTLVSGQPSTIASQPPSFEFRQEGIKIQFNFNTDRISSLRRIEHLLTSESLDQTLDLQSIVKTRLDTLNQRNKILKIADRHGCDTVHEYLDDPLADSVEDASKLRTAVNVQLASLTAEVVAEEVSMLENFFVASAKNLDPEMTTTVSKTTPSSSTTTDCAFNANDTLTISVPSKHVPSVVPSQHKPLLQVLHPCLHEKLSMI
ncbi:unnamed protein product [Mytilus edulis]|uniref:Lysostaphin N-terminal domain-containing protein n=1 Tax=Mytilus edulis TaxID=6550 RepID=A0A8S3URH3_MYTED|nr:unnamed protein product [Mytilus edulis]